MIIADFTGKAFVAVGAFLAGCGSVLSGIAALKNARKKGAEEAKKP